MGLFSVFKKNKGNENTEGNGNFLENYFKSRFKINTDHIQYSSNDIARIEKNCEILGKMGMPSYKELKLEKNEKAIRFYERNGFGVTGEKKLEEDTTEYLVLLRKKNS